MRKVRVDAPLPAEVADAIVVDRAGDVTTLGTHLRGATCLVSFLRHFGCTGCADHVADLAPRLPELHALGLRTVLVGNGEPRYIDGFLERAGLANARVTVLTDPTLRVFTAAGLVRSAWATIGPRAMLDALRARSRGVAGRGMEGDHFQQGGTLVVDRGGEVAFFHANASLGDHPRANDLVDVALRLVARSSAVVY